MLYSIDEMKALLSWGYDPKKVILILGRDKEPLDVIIDLENKTVNCHWKEGLYPDLDGDVLAALTAFIKNHRKEFPEEYILDPKRYFADISASSKEYN